MRIASWNINSVRARLEQLTAWLAECAPDIVLLQETKVMDAQFPTEAIEDMGYNLALFGQKSYNGVAILSKTPIDDVRRGLMPANDPDENPEARYIEAEVDGLRVASVYVPNGQEVGSEKFQEKLQFYDQLRTRMTHILANNDAYVLGGDFNVAPTDADVYDPHKYQERLFVTKAERQAHHRLLTDGMTDAIRSRHPGDHGPDPDRFTWWDYRAGSWQGNRGLRIDHMLISPEVLDGLKAVETDQYVRGQSRPSDHAPIWIDATPRPTPYRIYRG